MTRRKKKKSKIQIITIMMAWLMAIITLLGILVPALGQAGIF